MPLAVEICVTDLASAVASGQGGVDRLELCADLASGGVTPSLGLIRRVVSAVDVPVHVLIRPRGGDFVHDEDELATMILDLEAAREADAAGVVLGVLRRDSTVDAESLSRLLDAARPLSVTFHKAIDLVPDPLAALDTLVALGVDRVLTAGGPGPARSNLPTLRSMVRHAKGRLVVMAGGSIVAADIPALIEVARLDEFHLGSGVTGPAPAAGPFGARPAPVEIERVRRVVAAVKGHPAGPRPDGPAV